MPKRKRAAVKSEAPSETTVRIEPQRPEGEVRAQYADHVTLVTRDVDVRIAFWQVFGIGLPPEADSVPAYHLGSYVLTREGAEALLEALAGALGRALEPAQKGSTP